MSTSITSYIDIAQVVLYLFWVFFFGLIFYLRREDRREGYPLESDTTQEVGSKGVVSIPAPKQFALPHGGTYDAPDFKRYTGEIEAERTAAFPGAPLEPTADPMGSNVGPSAYALRADEPELTREGEPAIVPIRVATDFSVARSDTDPRGLPVVGTDGEVAGTVADIWIDRADPMIRYLEVDLPEKNGASARRVLLPMPMARVLQGRIEVNALCAKHFQDVPGLQNPDQITLWEEERISAFYAGGRMYAEPKRIGPLL